MSEEKNINPNSEQKNKELKKEKIEQHVPGDSHTTRQPITSDQQPSTENMEVHKHPHHVMHKKKWEEYFLEFLMLFLAVTLGFFAENLRERITESHREKEFARQLYSELKEDSASVAGKLAARLAKERDMDYLSGYFKDSSLTSLPRDFYPAYTTSTFLFNSYAFEPKDGILSQLRNSGSLRYFKSVALQKLLGDISVCINNVRYRNDQEYQFFASPIKPFVLKYYDFNWINQLRKKDSDPDAYMLAIVNRYRKDNRTIEGHILNVSSLDRSEASNMIIFYKQMLVSTRTLQLKDYVVTNHKILEELRRNYKLE